MDGMPFLSIRFPQASLWNACLCVGQTCMTTDSNIAPPDPGARIGLVAPEGIECIDCIAREYSPLPGFSVQPLSDMAPVGDELSLLAIIRMLSRGGAPLSRASYRSLGIHLECLAAPGLRISELHDGREGVLALEGDIEALNLALAGLAVVIRSDVPHESMVQVIITGHNAGADRDWYSDPLRPMPPGVKAVSVRVRTLGI